MPAIPTRLLDLPPELMGTSPAVTHAAAMARRAAMTDAPVLIVSEPGFDAGRVAVMIHHSGPRGGAPLIRLDCDAAPALVIEQLFGMNGRRRTDDYEAVGPASALARAGAGAVFLAGIDDMPAAAQARLARVLRDGEMRVRQTVRPARFRVLASAGPGLEGDVAERRFRPELFRRLQRVRVDVPALRDRPTDLPAVIARVFDDLCRTSGRAGEIAPAALTALAALRWPGNLDELGAALLRLLQASQTGTIRQEDVLADLQHAGAVVRRIETRHTLREARRAFERDYISAILEEHGWRMADAAHVLGIERANLYRKARQLGLTRLRSAGA